jgi:hypothetical protein
MRTSILSLSCLCRFAAAVFVGAVAVGHGRAATLPFDAPLHTQADDDSPVVGTLPAGTSIKSLLREELAAAGLDSPPPGWIVIRSAGPFAGFVPNREVESDGTIKPGAEIRGQPLADAPLLLIVEAGDVATAREPIGDWSRATIHTDLIVFVNALPPGSRSEMTEVAPMATPEAVTDNPPAPNDELVIDTSAPAEETRKPAKTREPKVEPTPVETAGAPRTFVGYLMRTRRFLGRGPKYNYHLVDERGYRICFVDVSALLATSTIESFENRRISVYGPGITRPDVKDLIIRVQTLRLER